MPPLTLLRRISLGLSLQMLSFVTAFAEPRHAIAMYGEPALPADYTHLPHANPDAPKGGEIVLGVAGSFDTLNPFNLSGLPVTGVTPLVVETLLGRNYDEAFSLYGLLAESVETDPERSFVEFTLRPEARFSNGAPVTVEDVLWSFETLGTKGNPRYHGAWRKISHTEVTGPRSVRFTFNAADRELPLILGLRPILQKASFEGRDFSASSLAPVIGSGPYLIDQVHPGQKIRYRRDPNYWGKDLAFNRGQWNFDTVTYEYFANPQAMFETFKAGHLSAFREQSPAKWALAYDFAAVQRGDIIKAEIAHQRPSGIEGFVFNTRNPLFADWRVREALLQAFHFEFINQVRNDGALPRIESYFSNSPLGMDNRRPAEGLEREFLLPFSDALLPGVIEGYALPHAQNMRDYRRGLRGSATLLSEAGWHVDGAGILRNVQGQPFSFEILLTVGQDELAAAAAIWVEALKSLGITAQVSMIDAAQMRERAKSYHFEVTHYVRSLSLSPGNEQMLYWGRDGVTTPGSGNWMGMDVPAADAMISHMLEAEDPDAFLAATRALDRILTAGRYVVPIWFADRTRLAHKAELKYPKHIPLYGDWLGFLPDTWWYEPR